MLEGMYVRSNFPTLTCRRIAAELFTKERDSFEPMKRNRQSGGTTDIM